MNTHDRKNPFAGKHYAVMAIKPTEFAQANGWDAAAHFILKYVSRHLLKNGAEDLGKALYMVDERAAARQDPASPFLVLNGHIVAVVGFVPHPDDDPRISMEAYISRNQIPPAEAQILTTLDDWVRSKSTEQRRYTDPLKRQLEALIDFHYGDPA